MKAEHVNPFIISVSKIMKDICMLDLNMGKPFVKDDKYEGDSSLIKLGIIGALKGEVVLSLHYETALAVISKMMMMPVSEIDAIGQSAISELGNMIAGNAATVFANDGIIIDITTPDYSTGEEHGESSKQMFCVPFTSDIGELSINIFIEE
ncbi:chemotaxis protein CheX [Eubacterium sp. MSJ-13]|uniref:chemotaxis protein CheX n=1 Tax=Eubacterium sp. MSJ-13 TaxID=2841513 RepID=UPI001C0F4E28|nr:chemotaxis protein CheX [Eubacterium sp. MSJ-13]